MQRIFSYRQLANLIFPLIVEQILMGAIGALDVIMVAQLGENAVSGVSLVTSIDQLIISTFSALAAGGAIVCAQYLGNHQVQESRHTATQLLFISALFGSIVGVVCFLLGRPMLNFLYGQAAEQVLGSARTYFYFAAAAYPLIALFDTAAALLRTISRTRSSLFVSLGMNLFNLMMNAIFIYYLRWGVSGAGAASLISRTLGTMLLLFILWHFRSAVSPVFSRGWRLDGILIRKILHVGVPAGIEGAIFHIGKLLVQGAVTSCGTTAIAANAVALTITEFLHMPGAGIGLGLITVVGQCVGAREYNQAKRYTRQLVGLAYATMGILNILAFIFAPNIMQLYGIASSTAVTASTILRWHSVVCFFLWPMGFTMVHALRAAGDVRFPMVLSIASMWVFRVGCSYLLLALFPRWGVLNVWFAMFLDWLCRATIYFWRYRSNLWIKKRVI